MQRINYRNLSPNDRKYYLQYEDELRRFNFEFETDLGDKEKNNIIYAAILQDNPDLFWLSGICECRERDKANYIIRVFLSNEIASFGIDRIKTMSCEMTERADAIIDSIPDEDEYAKALYIHDYLIDSITYDSEADYRHSAYGAIVEGRAVCDGYSAAFQYLMNRLEIPSGRVYGKIVGRKEENESGHAWNYIKLKGDFYFVDVTWDDPGREDTESLLEQRKYDYFCITQSEIQITHYINNEPYDRNLFFPSCNKNECNYFAKNHIFMERYVFEDVAKLATIQDINSNGGFRVKFSSTYELKKAVHDLIGQNKIFLIDGIVKGSIRYEISVSGLILTIFVDRKSEQ